MESFGGEKDAFRRKSYGIGLSLNSSPEGDGAEPVAPVQRSQDTAAVVDHAVVSDGKAVLGAGHLVEGVVKLSNGRKKHVLLRPV